MLTQNDEVAQLAVGDVALLDAARPAACFAGDSHWLRLQLPRQSLVSHLGCEPQGGLHARGETPAAHLLFDFVRNADKGEGSAVSLRSFVLFAAVEQTDNLRGGMWQMRHTAGQCGSGYQKAAVPAELTKRLDVERPNIRARGGT